MCGIAGIFHYADPDRPIDRNLLVRMTRTLRHRGPDDEGFFVDRSIGLGHRRLAIVDLTPSGHQPMSTSDGRSAITYNGEFYNHSEFRPALEEKGCRFRGTSDSETMLYLMDREGPHALAQTAGIFVFAVWNTAERTLLLARDHVGVKQLYYHDDGRRLIFANEIKALLCDPTVPRDIDPEAVNQYVHFHTPLADRTFFRSIRQLRPGTFLMISPTGRHESIYWRIESLQPRGGPIDESADELRSLFEKVVDDQLMSDVPVGSFFSGGIDSSAVAAFATRAGKKPHCYGVHFSGTNVIDEKPYQLAAAKALGVELDLITLSGDDFPDDMSRLMYYQDQPVIGPALIPMDAVSRLASSQVKVCLGGQAADEIFGGYARYALARPIRVLLNSRRKRPNHYGEAEIGGNLIKQAFTFETMWRLARAATYMSSWKQRYFETFVKVPEREWSAIFTNRSFISRARCRATFRSVVAAAPDGDAASQAMLWDLGTYLPGLFQQDDRMSMAHSLESRVPFADPRMVRFAFATSFDLKFRAGSSKWLLRNALSNVLPADILNRRKAGFDTPAEAWIRSKHLGYVRETLLSQAARSRGIWNMKAVERLLTDQQKPFWFDIVWKALSIEIWARLFLDREADVRLNSTDEQGIGRQLPNVVA